MHRILIVRLGSLGDIVHALPAAAALCEAWPQVRLDWLVDRRNLEILQLVPIIDRRIVLERPTLAGWLQVVRELRQTRYDVAIDLQGLLKSAALARASGARRIVGFAATHLRERTARPFYTEAIDPGAGAHVIHKNLALVAALGAPATTLRFPLRRSESQALAAVRAELARDPGGTGPALPCDPGGTGLQPCARYALINPGAAWPNKRWPPDRFGAVAACLRERFALPSVVLWGPGEEPLAQAVAASSRGAARVAPATTVSDLVELGCAAALMVSGDTGPLHIAAAVGAPVVSLFGPSDPHRNGPWSPDDEVVSRYEECGCHYQRTCRRQAWCLDDITVAEVTAAIQRRLARTGTRNEE
jgi:lipopolysaccharide heptosyltransferase I